jgi:hypothetical protein
VNDLSGVDISIQYPGVYGGWESRRLHVERIQIAPQRDPSVIPMPMVNKASTGEPVAFVLDLGMMSETIRLEGTIYDANAEPRHDTDDPDKGGTWMAWPEVERVFRTSWKRYEMGMEPTNYTLLSLVMDNQAGQAFAVLWGQLTLTRVGAKPYWGFVMSLSVIKWN